MVKRQGNSNNLEKDERERLMRECAVRSIINRETKSAIAEELGVSLPTIVDWTLHNAQYQRIAQEVAHRYFTDLVGDSIATIRSLLKARSEKVRLEAAKDILDRAGLKPIEKIDATHDVDFEITIGEYLDEEEE